MIRAKEEYSNGNCHSEYPVDSEHDSEMEVNPLIMSQVKWKTE